VNRNWSDDHLDHILREVMQSQPEHPPIEGLAMLAMEKAREQAVTRLRPDRLRRYSWWQQLITFAATAVVVIAVWFAANQVIFQGTYSSSETTVAASDQTDLLQVLKSDEAMLMAVVTLLIVAVVITVQRALSWERVSLAAWGPGDLL
jgi:magnesium-transporting ATPase (P-type)